MRNYCMQANDARFAAIAQGGQEQQRLSDMARQAGEFHNQAAQQQYEQVFGRGQFYNAGQQQDFSQAAQRGTFANAAQAQNFQQAQSAFNASNAARQQYLNETFALRNQPINEISALLSGSQVASPNFLNTQRTNHPNHGRCRADQSKLRPADGGVEPAGGDGKQHHWRAIWLCWRAWDAAAHSTGSRARLCLTHMTSEFFLRRPENGCAYLSAA